MSHPTLTRLAVAVFMLGAVGFSAQARDSNGVSARWMTDASGNAYALRHRSAVIGFVGCDMHAPRGPEVALVQVARGLVPFDAEVLIGEPCADALVRLQRLGLRLGDSRVIPGTATADPDCLAWDLLGPDVYELPSRN